MSGEGGANGEGAPEPSSVESSSVEPSSVEPSRLYTPRPLLAVSAAVFRDGRVLLAERARGPGRGRLALPGGLVEPGEALAAAAAREVMEEVGVRAAVLGLAGAVEVIERDDAGGVRFHAVVLAHAALWAAGEPREGPEAARVLWALPEEVAGLPTTDGLAAVVARAAALVAAAGRGG